MFAAFALRSFTGFGAALVAVTGLALFLDYRQVVIPLLAILSIFNTGFILLRSGRHAVMREALLLVAGALPGLALGLTFYTLGNEQTLRVALGVLIVILGSWLAYRGGWTERRTFSSKLAPLSGLAAGLTSGTFGISGPPLVVYLSGRGLNKDQFRATLMVFFIIADVLRLGYYSSRGQISVDLWLVGASLYPLSLLGTYIGERLHARSGERQYRRLVGATLAVLGLVIAVKAWLALTTGA